MQQVQLQLEGRGRPQVQGHDAHDEQPGRRASSTNASRTRAGSGGWKSAARRGSSRAPARANPVEAQGNDGRRCASDAACVAARRAAARRRSGSARRPRSCCPGPFVWNARARSISFRRGHIREPARGYSRGGRERLRAVWGPKRSPARARRPRVRPGFWRASPTASLWRSPALRSGVRPTVRGPGPGTEHGRRWLSGAAAAARALARLGAASVLTARNAGRNGSLRAAARSNDAPARAHAAWSARAQGHRA